MAEGEHRPKPPEKPDYTVYKSRRRLRDRVRKPDLGRPRRAASKRGEAPPTKEPRSASASPASARAAPGRRSGSVIAALAWIAAQLRSPSRSRRRSRSRSSPTASTTRSSGNPFMLAPADDPRARHRRALGRLRRARGGRARGLHRGGQQRRPKDDSCKNAPVPLRHDHADPRRRRHLPQALDPARHARRDPRPGTAEDQLRLRVGRREARDPDGRGPARDRRRPGRDHRLRRLSQLHRHDRRDRRRPPDRRLLERLRRRLQPRPRRGREPPRRLPGDHAGAHPLEHLRRRRVRRRRRRARPVPAADPRRDQGQADQHHRACPSTSSRAR